MIGAHQNLNGSRDLNTPFSGMVCHPLPSICYRQPVYQISSLCVSTDYEDIKGSTKCRKFGGLM